MMATVDSRINSRICAIISKVNRDWFIEGPFLAVLIISALRLCLLLVVRPGFLVGLGF